MTKAQEPESIAEELHGAGNRAAVRSQAEKKNYAERLSRLLATKVANGLRKEFPGVLPDADGNRQESKARTAKGFKKLDVNYSTPELGLGLGVSIKTLNFVDPKSSRFTKNFTRIDGELRAEAEDYHDRQPYSVLVALIFLPSDSYFDGKETNVSSFARAVQLFRQRGARGGPKDHATLMEGVFIGVYSTKEETFGTVRFFDVKDDPPKRGEPRTVLSFRDVLKEITTLYDVRNNPKFTWAEET